MNINDIRNVSYLSWKQFNDNSISTNLIDSIMQSIKIFTSPNQNIENIVENNNFKTILLNSDILIIHLQPSDFNEDYMKSIDLLLQQLLHYKFGKNKTENLYICLVDFCNKITNIASKLIVNKLLDDQKSNTYNIIDTNLLEFLPEQSFQYVRNEKLISLSDKIIVFPFVCFHLHTTRQDTIEKYCPSKCINNGGESLVHISHLIEFISFRLGKKAKYGA